MKTVNLSNVEREILALFRTCGAPQPAISALHDLGAMYIWRDGRIIRGAVGCQVKNKRLTVNWLIVQPGYQWTHGAELELLDCVLEEAQGKQIVWLTDDCDLREWLADQGFAPKRSKSGRSAMVLSGQESPVAQRLRKYFR